MKKIGLSALLLAAALFIGFGATTASAEGMKCGAGKCGSSMKKMNVSEGKSCNKKDCECGDNCKCGDDCKCADKKNASKCGSSMKKMNMSDGKSCNKKCGSEKKATSKCGANK